MYRYKWRQPGCLLILVLGVVAVLITGAVVRVASGVTDGPIDTHWTLLLAVPMFAGLWRLYVLKSPRLSEAVCSAFYDQLVLQLSDRGALVSEQPPAGSTGVNPQLQRPQPDAHGPRGRR